MKYTYMSELPYTFFFLERKTMAFPKILDEMNEQFGDNVCVDSDYFRPSVWRLYESHFSGVLFAALLCRHK